MSKNRRHVDPIDDFVHEVALLRQRISDLERNTHKHGSGGSGSVPVGTMVVDPRPQGVGPPTGYLRCNGNAVSRTDYADLFDVIGTTYGAGDGSTTFNLPDTEGRFLVGRDNAISAFDTIAATGGSKDAIVVAHIHTMPTHTHTMPTHDHSINHDHGAANTGNQSASHTHTTSVAHDHASVTSGSDSHSHAMPNLWWGFISGGNLGMAAGGAGNPSNLTGSNTNSDSHTHSVNLPNYNVANRTSTNQSASHTHSFNMPSFSGTSGSTDPGDTNARDPGDTNSTGSSGTDANLPPYLVIRWMIYAGV